MLRRSTNQLPMWPEPVRGAPNSLLRSAFFAGIHSKKRKFLGIQTKPEKEPEGVTIATQEGYSIKYAGTQLNQYDADVFFEALHQARRHPLGTECVFTGAAFLRAIGRPKGKLNYEDLEDSLRRLKRGTVDVKFRVQGHPFTYVGGLIANYTRADDSKVYKIELDEKISLLFAPASWSLIEWQERMALKGKPLAQWLHSYYSTHAAPFPVTVSFLKQMSGSPTALDKHFKTELKRAFDALHEILGWMAEWEGNRVSLTKPPSDAQGRHLARREHKRKMLAAVEAQAKKKARDERGLTPLADIMGDLFKPTKRRI